MNPKFHFCLALGFWFLAAAVSQAGSRQALPGIIQAFQEVVLSLPVDDLVAETSVEEGDQVQAGDVILRLRDTEQQLELKRSAAVLHKAEFDASANRALVKEKIVPEDKGLEQEVRLELAKLECETARIKAGERTLRSPISGILTRRLKDTGEAVSHLEPVAEVMRIDKVFVLLNLPEGSRASFRTGDAASVDVPAAEGGKSFEGKVSFIDPVINPGSGLFRVKILVENPDGLIRPGMRAQVTPMIDGDTKTSPARTQETSGGRPSDSSIR